MYATGHFPSPGRIRWRAADVGLASVTKVLLPGWPCLNLGPIEVVCRCIAEPSSAGDGNECRQLRLTEACLRDPDEQGDSNPKLWCCYAIVILGCGVWTYIQCCYPRRARRV